MYCMAISGDETMYKICDNVKDGREAMRRMAEQDLYRSATLWRMTPSGDLTDRVIDLVSL